jgi:hypothetical protein
MWCSWCFETCQVVKWHLFVFRYLLVMKNPILGSFVKKTRMCAKCVERGGGCLCASDAASLFLVEVRGRVVVVRLPFLLLGSRPCRALLLPNLGLRWLLCEPRPEDRGGPTSIQGYSNKYPNIWKIILIYECSTKYIKCKTSQFWLVWWSRSNGLDGSFYSLGPKFKPHVKHFVPLI